MNFTRLMKLAILAICVTAAYLPLSYTSNAVAAEDDEEENRPKLHKNSKEAGILRGSKVYAGYCVRCHGKDADGKGRAAKLYDPKPNNLRNSDKFDGYVAFIIGKGGVPLDRSEFMPGFDEELTAEQISDLVVYLRSINEFKP